jgi:CBS-domain-containing membrane protein
VDSGDGQFGAGHNGKTPGSSSEIASRMRWIKYTLFLGLFFIIIIVTAEPGVFLLAPPYAVSAYLVIFERNTRYARPQSIASSYLLVIGSSELFHLTIGISLAALLLNVVVVSAFITFTKYSHPPAIALTIFSYIVHSPISFATTSLLVLLVIIGAYYLISMSGILDTKVS